ncbi:MAG: 50S ribosomal protein L13 [Candidatus Bathyarchaeia archaeon]
MGEIESQKTTIIDAKGLVLGRMASVVAKRLLSGEKIIIVNAKEAVISGKKSSIIKSAEDFLQVGHFRKGPFHPRRPDNIVRKTIRGMIPHKKARGERALKRLKVFSNVPREFEEAEKETISEISARNLKCSYIKVSELARAIGWNE